MSDFGIPLPPGVSGEDMAAAFEHAVTRGVVDPNDAVPESEPAPTPEPTPAPESEPTPVAPAPEPIPAAEPTPAGDDEPLFPPLPVEQIYEVPGVPVQLTEANVRQLFEVAQYVSRATPEQAQLIDALLGGRDVEPELMKTVFPKYATPADNSDDDFLEPAIAERFKQQADELAAARREIAQLRQQPATVQAYQDVNAEARRHNEVSGTVAQEYATRYELTPEEVQDTWQRAVQTGAMARAAQKYGPNLEAAYRETFQAGLQANPTVMEKIVNKRVADKLAKTQNESKKDKAASATGGGGGSVPRTPPELPPAPANATNAELSAALAKAIAPLMDR